MIDYKNKLLPLIDDCFKKFILSSQNTSLTLPDNFHSSKEFKELKEKKEHLEKKIKEVIREHKENDKELNKKGGNKPKDNKNEKRLKRLKEKADKIEEFLRENEPRIGSSGKEVQSNTTDNESAKMALTVLTMTPVLAFYPYFQKYFVKGLTLGVVKG